MGHPNSDGKQIVGYMTGTQNINLGRDRSLGVPDTQRWYGKPLEMRREGPVPRVMRNSSFLKDQVGDRKAFRWLNLFNIKILWGGT